MVAGFAGRGALWAPWAYIHAFRPLVIQASALDLREAWVTPFVSALLMATLFLLGFSAHNPALPSWYDYFLHARYRRQYADDSRRGDMVSCRRAGETNTGAIQ